jgi:hypothetical protein
MAMTITRMTLLLGPMLLLGACASTAGSQDAQIQRMMLGESQVSGRALERRLAEAERHPLGSRENPVRAQMPPGQRAYLSRLRCSDGRAPEYFRTGNLGPGVYGNIIDAYRVSCGDAAPGTVEIIMDMYHAGHVEERPVPGFTIVPSMPTV